MPKQIIPQDTRNQIKTYLEDGWTVREVAGELGLTVRRVQGIRDWNIESTYKTRGTKQRGSDVVLRIWFERLRRRLEREKVDGVDEYFEKELKIWEKNEHTEE